MFYSKVTGGFYSPEIHGDTMPADVVHIDDSEYEALLNGQSEGKQIGFDADGLPVLVTPALPTGDDAVKLQIAEFEASVTQRRLREAVLNIDNGWLADINSKIAALRTKLK